MSGKQIIGDNFFSLESLGSSTLSSTTSDQDQGKSRPRRVAKVKTSYIIN